jgi:pectin methylesterase-like acyl-CoA thioesterase
MSNKPLKFFLIIAIALFNVVYCKAIAPVYDITVAKDGSGKYSSIQAAIDAAPEGRTTPFKILIKKGLYNEQIRIPAAKPFLELVGEDPATTLIAFGNGRAQTSAFSIMAKDVMLMNLTLENTQGRVSDGPQSLAIRTDADRIVFYNCRFISGQDTVLTNRDGNRIYFSDCYIDGGTDYIYGAAIDVFDRCVIYTRDHINNNRSSYLTAANTPKGQAYGFVFRDCILPNNHGITTYTLGRPWHNDIRTETQGAVRAENKVVFLNTKMSSNISLLGWSVWGDKGTDTKVITYAEYKSKKFDGTPVDVSKRVDWSKQLTDAEAAPYYVNANMFGDWDPFAVWADMPHKAPQPPITVGNFFAKNGDNQALLQFNSSWPIKGVTYTLYKSMDKAGSFKEVDHLVAKSDTTIAFQFKDALPSNGHPAYYQVKATKGKATFATDTLSVDVAELKKQRVPVVTNKL